MRLNNRIKVLKVKMSLSGCYLEQLSQRYRMQMEEMQRAFYKAIIKLQSTLWNIEEQCKKNGESIQVLQKQMEKLSLQVSALQIYVLLSVVLSILIVIYLHYCRTSDLNPSQEPETSLPKSYSCCCPDRDSPENEDVNPKRRASYPFSHSAMQIATTEGTPSKSDMETVEVDQLESIKVIETFSMTEGGQRGPTVPLLSPLLSETTVTLTPEPVQTTVTKEDQIVTLLPEDESEDQDKSSRYRMQMEEMQRAFYKAIIILQSTLWIIEEQCKKNAESIQVLQKQMEKLSLQVSNLQREVSVLQIYVLLSVVLIILSILIIIYLHYCYMLDSNLSSESETSIPKSYSCRDSPENEDVNPKRRASYPFSHSAMQIATTEGPSKAYNVETQNNSTGSKKHCKLKSSTKPETITPTLLSTVITIWMPPHSTTSTPFSFRDSPPDGSFEDSLQSDKPSTKTN